jgi:hypothetical protein
MIERIRQLFADPAVRWLAVARIIPIVAAPVALWFLITRQPLSTRGFYLIAINVVMFAQLFETGMGTLVVQFASRVRPSERGTLRGAASTWYGNAALLLVIAGATIGTYVFWQGASPGQLPVTRPWIIALACTAAYVWLAPLICLREGLGGGDAVQKMRAVQALLVAIVMIAGLMRGRGIDAAAAAAVAQLLVAGVFVWRERRALPKADAPTGRIADQYRAEQRKSARVWIALWIAPQLLTPATMLMRGAADAGDIGLHVSLAFAPALLAIAWMHARYPRLGALVASGALRTFDDTARKAFAQAVTVYAGAGAAVIGLAFLAPYIFPFLAGRVLSPLLVTVLLLGNLTIVAFQAMLAWFRAFGDEKFASQVVVACAAMAVGGVGGSAMGGGFGGAVGYAATGIVMSGALGVGFARHRAHRLAGG